MVISNYDITNNVAKREKDEEREKKKNMRERDRKIITPNYNEKHNHRFL